MRRVLQFFSLMRQQMGNAVGRLKPCAFCAQLFWRQVGQKVNNKLEARLLPVCERLICTANSEWSLLLYQWSFPPVFNRKLSSSASDTFTWGVCSRFVQHISKMLRHKVHPYIDTFEFGIYTVLLIGITLLGACVVAEAGSVVVTADVTTMWDTIANTHLDQCIK